MADGDGRGRGQQRGARGSGRPQEQAQAPQQAREVASVQEGSRWRYSRPPGAEVGSWFEENVHLHEGLEHERYVQGIVLIPASEKVKRTFEKPDGSHVQIERWDQTFTPYAKVETRVAYFWDLMALHPEWVGVIEPVEVLRTEEQGYKNTHLPPGFFRMPLQKSGNEWVDYLCCSMRVRVFHRDDCRIEVWQDKQTGEPMQRLLGKTVIEGSPGTKMVPVAAREGPDPNLIMKAETGAVGRALGMAGMLVIPGSGVATAEDMQEAAAQGPPQATEAALPADETAALALPGAPAAPEGAQPPATEPAAAQDEPTIRARIAELAQQIEGDARELFQAWAIEKKIDTEDIKEHQLRGVLRKLEELTASEE